MDKYLDLLILFGFLGTLMWGMMKFMLRDIHKDLLEIKENHKRIEEKMDRNETRIDHLYQICIQTLQTRK